MRMRNEHEPSYNSIIKSVHNIILLIFLGRHLVGHLVFEEQCGMQKIWVRPDATDVGHDGTDPRTCQHEWDMSIF